MLPSDEEIAQIVARAERRIREWNSMHGHGRAPVEPFLAREHGEIILFRDLLAAITALRLRLHTAHGSDGLPAAHKDVSDD